MRFWSEVGKFVREVFQDGDGAYSSKRLITFLAFALVAGAAIANMAFGIALVHFMFDGLMTIVLGGLFATTGENVVSGWVERGTSRLQVTKNVTTKVEQSEPQAEG